MFACNRLGGFHPGIISLSEIRVDIDLDVGSHNSRRVHTRTINAPNTVTGSGFQPISSVFIRQLNFFNDNHYLLIDFACTV